MALFKIEKGLAINLEANRPYTKEGYAYFTTDDGKLYIDIYGDGTTPARIGKDRICLNAANADTADYAIKAKYNEAGYIPNSVSYTNESSDGVKIGTLNIDGGAFEILYPAPLRISYVASEGQTEFDIPFDFPSINSLTVYHNGVLLEMNKHYTINKANKKLTLNEYSCLSGDDFTIMGINGSANISTGIQYLDDTRILFTDRKNLMLDNSGITMGSNYVPNNDYDVVIKSYVDNLYDQGSMKLYKPQPITIGNTTKEFDGSDGLAWSLEEIGAAAAVHSHKYLPLTGGILTGDLSVPNNIINAKKLVSEYLEGTAEYANRLQNAHTFTIGDTGKDFDGTEDVSWTLAELGVDGNYLKLTGGTLTGSLTLNDDPTEALQASTKQYVDNNLKKYLPLMGGEITGELSASKFLGDLTGTADAAKEANKLATARALKIGNTSKNFDGSAGLTWTLSEIGAAPTTAQYEAYLTWGGTNHTGDFSPIDAALCPWLGANRFAFGAASAITVEYSINGGSTWTDYGLTSAQKIKLMSLRQEVSLGGKSSAGGANTQLRVTIDTSAYPIYSQLNKFIIYWSTEGASGCWCSIDASLESTPTTWVNFANKIPMSGWSGYNVINTSKITTYGNSPSYQYGLLRFTFGLTSPSSSGALGSLYSIYGYGGMGWTTPSNMAQKGTLYDYDENQNAIFPAQITATAFNGNATSATNVYIADDTSSKLYVLGATTTGNTRIYRESSVYISGNVLYGAAWNDYAEYRKATINKPGKCIVEKGDDTLIQSTARLQPGAAIISDTFGFAIGETDDCKTPIAVSGRVLAYPYESREEFKKNIGRPVCSGPNGTVSIMTDEEYKEKGYLAIGTISAVPDYEEWGTGNVKVNDRVWIKIL